MRKIQTYLVISGKKPAKEKLKIEQKRAKLQSRSTDNSFQISFKEVREFSWELEESEMDVYRNRERVGERDLGKGTTQHRFKANQCV